MVRRGVYIGVETTGTRERETTMATTIDRQAAFCDRYDLPPHAIHHAMTAAKWQQLLDDYHRGWEAAGEDQDGNDPVAVRAEQKYQRMVTSHASLGRVSRRHYIDGYVDGILLPAAATKN
jgi:hypothetical protein